MTDLKFSGDLTEKRASEGQRRRPDTEAEDGGGTQFLRSGGSENPSSGSSLFRAGKLKIILSSCVDDVDLAGDFGEEEQASEREHT